MDVSVVYGKVNVLEREIKVLKEQVSKVNRLIDLEFSVKELSVSESIILSVPLKLNTNKMLIHTIYIEALNENASIECEIRSKSTATDYFVYYKNV